jgi:hypothetical protein
MPDKRISELSIGDLEKKFNAKSKAATIIKDAGKYYLEVEGNKNEINPALIISDEPIEKLAEKRDALSVIITPQGIHVIIIPKKIPILCYIPRPDFLHVIEKEQRAILINTLVKEKTISSAFGKQLLKEINTK